MAPDRLWEYLTLDSGMNLQYQGFPAGYLASVYGLVFQQSASSHSPITSDGRPPDPDTVEILIELAKQDRKQDFVDLARMVGVAEADCEPFWQGTRRRLAKEDPA